MSVACEECGKVFRGSVDGENVLKAHKKSCCNTDKDTKSISQLLACYLCGRQYGTKSLIIHLPQCYDKRMNEWERADASIRGDPPPDPIKVDIIISDRGSHIYDPCVPTDVSHEEHIERWNQRQISLYNKSLPPCQYCYRTFTLDALTTHIKSCKKKEQHSVQKPPPKYELPWPGVGQSHLLGNVAAGHAQNAVRRMSACSETSTGGRICNNCRTVEHGSVSTCSDCGSSLENCQKSILKNISKVNESEVPTNASADCEYDFQDRISNMRYDFATNTNSEPPTTSHSVRPDTSSTDVRFLATPGSGQDDLVLYEGEYPFRSPSQILSPGDVDKGFNSFFEGNCSNPDPNADGSDGFAVISPPLGTVGVSSPPVHIPFPRRGVSSSAGSGGCVSAGCFTTETQSRTVSRESCVSFEQNIESDNDPPPAYSIHSQPTSEKRQLLRIDLSQYDIKTSPKHTSITECDSPKVVDLETNSNQSDEGFNNTIQTALYAASAASDDCDEQHQTDSVVTNIDSIECLEPDIDTSVPQHHSLDDVCTLRSVPVIDPNHSHDDYDVEESCQSSSFREVAVRSIPAIDPNFSHDVEDIETEQPSQPKHNISMRSIPLIDPNFSCRSHSDIEEITPEEERSQSGESNCSHNQECNNNDGQPSPTHYNKELINQPDHSIEQSEGIKVMSIDDDLREKQDQPQLTNEGGSDSVQAGQITTEAVGDQNDDNDKDVTNTYHTTTTNVCEEQQEQEDTIQVTNIDHSGDSNHSNQHINGDGDGDGDMNTVSCAEQDDQTKVEFDSILDIPDQSTVNRNHCFEEKEDKYLEVQQESKTPPQSDVLLPIVNMDVEVNEHCEINKSNAPHKSLIDGTDIDDAASLSVSVTTKGENDVDIATDNQHNEPNVNEILNCEDVCEVSSVQQNDMNSPQISSSEHQTPEVTPSVPQKEEEGSYEDIERVQCDHCGRNFIKDRIEKHQQICKKTKMRKLQQPSQPVQPLPEIDENAAPQAGSNWRRKTAALREALRSARATDQALKSGVPLKEIPVTYTNSKLDDRVSCPYCNRKVSKKVAESHFTSCATTVHRPRPRRRLNPTTTGETEQLLADRQTALLKSTEEALQVAKDNLNRHQKQREAPWAPRGAQPPPKPQSYVERFSVNRFQHSCGYKAVNQQSLTAHIKACKHKQSTSIDSHSLVGLEARVKALESRVPPEEIKPITELLTTTDIASALLQANARVAQLESKLSLRTAAGNNSDVPHQGSRLSIEKIEKGVMKSEKPTVLARPPLVRFEEPRTTKSPRHTASSSTEKTQTTGPSKDECPSPSSRHRSLPKRHPLASHLSEGQVIISDDGTVGCDSQQTGKSSDGSRANRNRKTTENESPTGSPSLRQSEGLRSAIQCARDYDKALEAIPSINLDDRIPCPHCHRKFSARVADRHIPACATSQSRPKPPPSYAKRAA